jgi:hypothetical protein
MTEGSLVIDSVRLGMEAATSFDRAERTATRVREAMKTGLQQALSEACGRELKGDGYFFIERLQVASQVAVHWHDDRIATRLAQQIGIALSKQMSHRSGLTFRDRAEFVGAYASSVVESCSANRWWFAEFDGLAALPLSERLRTLLINEGKTALQALVRVSSTQRQKIIRALHEADVRRVLEQLPNHPCPFPPNAIIEAFEAIDGEALSSATHAVLEMLIDLTAVGSGAVTRQTAKRLELLQALIDAVRSGRLVSIDTDAAQISRSSDVAAAAMTVLSRWTDSIGGDALLAASLHAAAQRIVKSVVKRSTKPEVWLRHTPYGGAFLLLATLDRGGWWEAWQREFAKEVEGSDVERLLSALSLAVVARALNPRRCHVIEMDEGLRSVFCPETCPNLSLSKPDRRRLEALLGSAGPAKSICRTTIGLTKRLRLCSLALLTAFSERIPGCAGSSPEYIRRNLLALHARVSSDGCDVRLGSPPLDVLLTLSGLKRAAVGLPRGRILRLQPDLGP